MPVPNWLKAILGFASGGVGAALFTASEASESGAFDDLKNALVPESGANKELLAFIKENFDEQFHYIADKEAMFNRYKLDLLNTIKDAPLYTIPQILTDSIDTIKEYATEAKDAYINGAQDVQKDIEEGVSKAISAVYENTNKAIEAVKEGADQSNKAYEAALKETRNTSNAMLQTAKEGFGEALSIYKDLADQGLKGFTKYQTEAIISYTKGGTDITELADKLTPQMVEAAKKAASVYEGEEAEGVVEGYKEAGEKIRDITREKAGEIEGYAEKSAESQLAGAQGMLDVYGDLARQKELPGQRLIEEKLGSNMAQLANRLRREGGGEASTLTAYGQAASAKNQQLQDLAIQAAEYRTNRQSDFAGAIRQAAEMKSGAYSTRSDAAGKAADLLTTGETAATVDEEARERLMGKKSGVYSDLVTNLSNILGSYTGSTATGTELTAGSKERAAINSLTAFLDAASSVGGATEDITKFLTETEASAGSMNIDAWLRKGDNAARLSELLENAYFKKGEMESEAEFYGSSLKGWADETKSRMEAEGYTTAAGLEKITADMFTEAWDKKYESEFNPWDATVSYYQDLMNRTDMTSEYLGLKGDEAGFMTELMNANTESMNMTREQFNEAFTKIFKTFADPSQVLPSFIK